MGNPDERASDGLPANSPLDPLMWAPSAIESAWGRVDRLEAVTLRCLPNIAEWMQSSRERSAALESIVELAHRDLSDWGADALGVLPAGVGGLTLAVRIGGRDGVAKWIAEVEERARRGLIAQMFSDAGIGPTILASSADGFLMERIVPSSPLRSAGSSRVSVRRSAEMLPQVRSLHIPSHSVFQDPMNQIVFAASTIARSDRADSDGFASRAHESALVAADAVTQLDVHVGHGDFQLGNVLETTLGKLMLIDGSGSVESGYCDVARLVVHSLADAWGSGQRWDLRTAIRECASWAGLASAPLARVCLAQAAQNAWTIRRLVHGRDWEWRALDAMCVQLSDPSRLC